MFSETRARFIDIGVRAEHIHRMHGVNPATPPRGYAEQDMRKSNFLSKYFLEHFAPLATMQFNDDNVAAVCWAEDDCHVKRDITVQKILQEIKAAAPAGAWLGFNKVDARPRYGAHLLGFTKQSLEKFTTSARNRYREKRCALDTIVWHMSPHCSSRQRSDTICIRSPTESMATQRSHDLRGRRLP